MKYLTILILSVFFAGSLSVLIKKNMVKRMQGNALAINLQGYPEAILQEINIFRKKEHYSPFINWQNQLAGSAQKEATDIIAKNSFGEHANFINWKNSFRNRFFTELALEADTEGMMPSKRIFAKTIVEALKQEQEWYLIHAYTHAGVAMYLNLFPLLQTSLPDKKPHKFIVVVHLARSPTVFHSCKEALSYGVAREELEILLADGKKQKVKCDIKTLGGGWTRVLDMGLQSYGVVETPINDLGMKYSELLFRAKPNYSFDYAKDAANNWDFDSYIFPLNALKFDDSWYMSEQSPTHTEANVRGSIKKILYNMNDKNVLEVITGSEKCFFGTANKKEFCAKEFVLKKLPEGKLKAISDVESITKLWTGDNSWNQQYEIFLR